MRKFSEKEKKCVPRNNVTRISGAPTYIISWLRHCVSTTRTSGFFLAQNINRDVRMCAEFCKN